MTVPSAPTQEITTKQRLMLFVLLGAGFMLSVDFSIMTVALPRLRAGGGVGPGSPPSGAAPPARAPPDACSPLLSAGWATLSAPRGHLGAAISRLPAPPLRGASPPAPA